VKTDEGTITEEVREVVWSGGKIPPESFLDFPISTSVPDNDSGRTLTFKTLQSYDNGKVTRWIGPESSDTPAPTVNVTAKNGVLADVAGSETGPGSSQTMTQPASSAAKSSSSKRASKGLGIAALAVAVVALLLALGGIALARRPGGGAARG
jgi:hypothetical protein